MRCRRRSRRSPGSARTVSLAASRASAGGARIPHAALKFRANLVRVGLCATARVYNLEHRRICPEVPCSEVLRFEAMRAGSRGPHRARNHISELRAYLVLVEDRETRRIEHGANGERNVRVDRVEVELVEKIGDDRGRNRRKTVDTLRFDERLGSRPA